MSYWVYSTGRSVMAIASGLGPEDSEFDSRRPDIT